MGCGQTVTERAPGDSEEFVDDVAFLVLRLQESRSPDDAHQAFLRVLRDRQALQLQHTKDQERIEELETALQRIRDWDENGKVFTGIHASAAVQIAYDALYTPTYPKEGGE